MCDVTARDYGYLEIGGRFVSPCSFFFSLGRLPEQTCFSAVLNEVFCVAQSRKAFYL